MDGPSIAVPESVLRRNQHERGEAGRAWAERLPEIVAACSANWGVRVEAPYPDLSYNYAAPVRLADGQPAVLKACFPDREFHTEAAALRLFDADGAVRLLAADLDNGAMLLERLTPGIQLSTVADDAAATELAAGVMRGLPRPPPQEHPFPTMAEWLARSADRCRVDVPRRGEREPAWLARALAVAAELRADGPPPVVLHGDLHHHNVLSAERSPWLAIDPKGVLGEPADEVGPWVENRARSWHVGDDEARRWLVRLIDQLAGLLAIDRPRLLRAAFVRSALSEMWTLEGAGPADPNHRAQCPELLLPLV